METQTRNAAHPAHPDSNPTDPAQEQDDEFAYWRFEDLLERRIVSDRNDLFRKQLNHGFPRALKTIQSQNAIGLFKRSAVKQWLRDTLKQSELPPPPPRRPRKQPQGSVEAAE